MYFSSHPPHPYLLSCVPPLTSAEYSEVRPFSTLLSLLVWVAPIYGHAQPLLRVRARAVPPGHGPPDPKDPDAARIARLHASLQGLLHPRPLAYAHAGADVVRAERGQHLFAHNPDKKSDPPPNERNLT